MTIPRMRTISETIAEIKANRPYDGGNPELYPHPLQER